MLATVGVAPLRAAGWVYEPKYDGIRTIAELDPEGSVRLWSRLGHDKAVQFPEITGALSRLAASIGVPVVLDGEIVALDRRGRPAGFQGLQGRIHLSGAKDIERASGAQPTAFMAFDILKEDDEDLRGRPLLERRARLERRLGAASDTRVRLSAQVAGDGSALMARAEEEGWEGLIAKEARSVYQSGRRSPAWRKLKILKRQEFVVGGWTEPRQTRSCFGALLLGVYDDEGRLQYVGHTGTGFDEKELARVYALLKKRETRESPFASRIKTNEPAHWVRPDLVAEVRFTEWTADAKLRHPVYLGLRDDKAPRDVVAERAQPSAPGGAVDPYAPLDPSLQPVIDRLRELEDARQDGVVELPNGDRVGVTNLRKVFWPEGKITKGELLRYYAAASPYLLPVVQDRPLVMKRFPNGVEGNAFYQQRSREEKPPPGVRIETLPDELDPIGEPEARRLVGGSLTTLLYMTQIAAISQDPWFSRVQSPLDADYVAIDLDPTDEAPFSRVLDVARWVQDELRRAAVPGFPKTSGASGLHVYLPLPPGTSYESGLLLCQLIATMVAARHPKVATIERKVRARPSGTVYVDFLQNILGKTLATAYSARASAFAGVSTPLAWEEIDAGVDPRDFTVRTAVSRFRATGDLWAGLRSGKPADLRSVLKKYGGG
ncbi:MAG TPA: DNA ligase D [Vicinamibacterales bacterium]|nr:DNA ligase D [Vicinamibacterales bacterium]